MLAYALAKKDASYIELFVTPIINQKPTYLDVFHTELIELLKQREEGGPKTDLHRMKALQMITKAIYRLLQSKTAEDGDCLTSFLKQGSKEIKKVVIAAFVNHDKFKIKKIAIMKRYVELAVALLRGYQAQGLAKRFISLKEAIAQEQGNLPAEPVLTKAIKKLNEIKMEGGEEPIED